MMPDPESRPRDTKGTAKARPAAVRARRAKSLHVFSQEPSQLLGCPWFLGKYMEICSQAHPSSWFLIFSDTVLGKKALSHRSVLIVLIHHFTHLRFRTFAAGFRQPVCHRKLCPECKSCWSPALLAEFVSIRFRCW